MAATTPVEEGFELWKSRTCLGDVPCLRLIWLRSRVMVMPEGGGTLVAQQELSLGDSLN